ncbi:hypothetical protein A9Z42_0037880 [Trichoderma parareesei]|uniref:Uncharacterized protein n=1 Tax=Trichoderma parareesei TaxID=858221 RepID=A0A2H2ZBE7_TRIPA|nr:hypothetical protein A9Z42_0037880 [Trichoderma parareesei]
MDPNTPLKELDPQPIDSPVSSRPFGITTAPPTTTLPMRPAMDHQQQQQQTNHPSGMDLPRATPVSRSAEFKPSDFPPKPNDYAPRAAVASDYPKAHDFPPRSYEYPVQVPRPMQQLQSPYKPAVPQLGLEDVKASCQRNLKHLMYLQNQRRAFGYSSQAVDLEWQIRGQTGVLIGELRTLQDGAFYAESLVSSNNTEYAFRKSKGLLQRIKDSVLGHGRLASIAFFVFSVLYVFQNEVTLRVAKTVQKRLKKLSQRLEYSSQEIEERDLKALEGWRWRVILW